MSPAQMPAISTFLLYFSQNNHVLYTDHLCMYLHPSMENESYLEERQIETVKLIKLQH